MYCFRETDISINCVLLYETDISVNCVLLYETDISINCLLLYETDISINCILLYETDISINYLLLTPCRLYLFRFDEYKMECAVFHGIKSLCMPATSTCASICTSGLVPQIIWDEW